ncbi:MAG TPA: nucleotide exchange factor GrpE [Candidatus Limnocylindria bacterium]|nr:nucleotide exchange factor GrpE [Candidatus Limnocylindria bacterium]
MDEEQRRAEQLLEERMKSRKPNGATATEPTETEASTDDAQGAGDYKADLQRMAADFANYRKRNEAERAEFAKYAKGDLITKLLDVLDGYDRALASVPDDAKGQPWVEGMWLLERKLRQILDAEGLEPIESLGKPFDPYVHEAVAHVESDRPEGTVIDEHQKAYRLHDRVIRPALVSVAKAKNKE